MILQRKSGCIHPTVTFFFLCGGNGERGGADDLSGGVCGAAGVRSGVFGEGVHDEEHGGVRGLVEVEHHVLGGQHRAPVVEPADLGPRRAGDAGVETSDLAMRHRAAADRLQEHRLVAESRLLYGGEAGGEEALRDRRLSLSDA